MDTDYRVLYRRWRPQHWRDVVGQEHVVRALRNALVRERVSHAYLFSGPRGTGKTTIARILAKAVNCQAPVDGEPCGTCPACTRIGQGTSTDVLEMDAASNRGIEEIRALREQARFAPVEERVKVYIVDEVHMLTAEAANALLKTLEEPPPRLMFVLCTTDPQKLPSTVLSRCQHFALRRLNVEEVAGRLREVAEREGLTITAEAVALLAGKAEGAMRDALAMLDQVRALAGDDIDQDAVLLALGGLRSADMARLVAALERASAADVLAWMDERWREGADPRQLAAALRDLWHVWMLRAVGTQAEAPVPAPQGWTANRLVSGLERWIRVTRDVRYTDDPRLSVEVALVETVQEGAGETQATSDLAGQLGTLAERVTRLEQTAFGRTLTDAKREDRAPSLRPEATARPTGARRAAIPSSRVAAPPVASQGAGGAGGDGSSNRSERSGGAWERVLARLRVEHPRVAAILAEGRLEATSDEEVHVRMPFEFHFQEMQRAENRALVEAALAVVYGSPRRLILHRVSRPAGVERP